MVIGRTSSGTVIGIGLDEGEQVLVDIGAGWEFVGGGGSGLGIGLEEARLKGAKEEDYE